MNLKCVHFLDEYLGLLFLLLPRGDGGGGDRRGEKEPHRSSLFKFFSAFFSLVHKCTYVRKDSSFVEIGEEGEVYTSKKSRGCFLASDGGRY